MAEIIERRTCSCDIYGNEAESQSEIKRKIKERKHALPGLRCDKCDKKVESLYCVDGKWYCLFCSCLAKADQLEKIKRRKWAKSQKAKVKGEDNVE